MKKKSIQIAKGILCFIVFMIFVIPIYWAFVTSIKQPTEMFLSPPTWFTLKPTLEHYVHVMKYTQIPLAFRNSLIISFSSTLISCMLSLLAAYGFSRFSFRLKNATLITLLVTRMLPASILIIPLYTMMNKIGLLDSFSGLIMVYVSMNIPFSVWILKTFFDSIPSELDQAAMIDGCNLFATFTRIILPLTKPGIIAASILCFFSCWNEFIIALMLTSSSKIQPLSFALRAFMSEQGVEWGSMMAAGVLAILPPALFFIIFQKYFIAGIAGGAIKG